MSIDSILIAGSGVLSSAWQPVYRAIAKTSNHKVDNPDVANLYMARLIFDARFFRNAVMEESTGVKEKLQKSEDLAKTNLKSFRNQLAMEISDSLKASEICLRTAQLSDVQKELYGQTTIMTTNWELDSFKPINHDYSIAIHGSISNPDSLYLPAETSFDNNVDAAIAKSHKSTHYTAISYLESAYKIVIWGLGINALDAELSVVFSEAFFDKNKNKREYQIVIFDLSPEMVANKLNMFGADKKRMKLVTIPS